jgi:4-amino-4-deoxy-L-arabinose transferase-like glycosyltransferase
MSKQTRIWLLSGILIIATFLRFYHFTTVPPGLYPDEAIDGNNAAEVVATEHSQVFYVEDNGREGLYVNIIAIELAVAQHFGHLAHEPWVIRLPAAIAGVLTVLGLYLLASELFGAEVALLAAFLLATSVWHIIFSRIGFRAILAPLLLTWTVWLMIKMYKASAEKNSSRRAAYWYAVIAGIVFGLGFYTYIAYRVAPLLLLLFIPFFKKYSDFWKRSAAFVVVAFIVAAPIGWYFIKHPSDFFGRTSEISVSSAGNPVIATLVNVVKTAAMFNFSGDQNWRQNISGAPELFWPVGIIFLLGIGWAIYWLIKNRQERKSGVEVFSTAPDNRFALWLIFLWFALAFLPVVLSNEGIPHALRSILMIPPAMMLAALGGIWIYRAMEKYWGATAARTIGVLFLIACAVFAYVDYFIIWAENPNVPGAFNADYVIIGREINALPDTTPKYVIVNAGGVPIRGLPTPVETTMFITNTFTTSTQIAKNIHYLLPDQSSTIPAGTPSGTVFEIN